MSSAAALTNPVGWALLGVSLATFAGTKLYQLIHYLRKDSPDTAMPIFCRTKNDEERLTLATRLYEISLPCNRDMLINDTEAAKLHNNQLIAALALGALLFFEVKTLPENDFDWVQHNQIIFDKIQSLGISGLCEALKFPRKIHRDTLVGSINLENHSAVDNTTSTTMPRISVNPGRNSSGFYAPPRRATHTENNIAALATTSTPQLSLQPSGG
ncbi:MAG: hypothetical protein KIT27_11435 [Legionellales bacterium]|nr:hypothetical protein [Legionellales bacterium]